MNERYPVSNPQWKSVLVHRHLPESLLNLEKLSQNLWWCWNSDAKELFRYIDPVLWHESEHNPIAILDGVSLDRFHELEDDKEFLFRLRMVVEKFNDYMAVKAERKAPLIGYFSMEYGLDTSLKIYSGGLGILAGDYLKETSDMNVNLVAVGLLYRFGYFTQRITPQGNQVADYVPQNFNKIPGSPVLNEDGSFKTISLNLPGRTLFARIWKVEVGRTDLYLLDTDFENNLPEDRQITHQLYGGDWENRLKQEMLLGIGGIRALRALGLNPDIYHCNEGHAAFTGLERLREHITVGLKFYEALEVVRATGLFTTHTPVPAGHDSFDEGLMGKYLGYLPGQLGVGWRTFMSLGKHNADNRDEHFSMSILALALSQNVNGVSKLHGKVSQEIFADLFPGYLPEENFISYVTNGVHYPTWAAESWQALEAPVFGKAFQNHHYDKSCFEGIYRVPDKEIWETRKALKKELARITVDRLTDSKVSAHYTPSQIVKIIENYDPEILTIGFARRFATYKRATLLFSDLNRLDQIVNNPERPVQFIFAGKAHPADGMGQDFIRQVIEISKQDRFIGKIIFIPGYDISLAKRLVQGVDVWLNNPTRPQEASGTSGEKAAMNGVMHFSVLDGWWVEGYQEGCGWSLPMEQSYEDNNYQNELDASTIYAIIESQIAPKYYDIDKNTGRSSEWIRYIKNTIAKVASNFTTNRMLTDYCNQYYYPQYERSLKLTADGCAKARELAAWKEHILQVWNNIRIVELTQPEERYVYSEVNTICFEVKADLAGLSPEDIGFEILFTSKDAKGCAHISEKIEYGYVGTTDGIAEYRVSVIPQKTGAYDMAIRMFPKHPDLPHRQDFPIVRWL